MKKVAVPLVSLALTACSAPKLDDSRHQTGSSSISTSSDYSALYVANSAEGSITRVDLGGSTVELDLEGEPTRVARAGDKVFVTLRTEKTVAVLDDSGSSLDLETTFTAGTEPVGIVVDEAGTRAYVAASLDGVVREYDAQSLELLRSWEIPDEPRWLALHPAGVLYVGSAFNGTLSWIKLDKDEVVTTHLPTMMQFSAELGMEIEMSTRITGDLAVTPDGEYVAVPAMYLDTTTPVIEPDENGQVPTEDVVPEEAGGYAGGATERFNPTVAVVPVEPDGEPHVEDAELVRAVAVNLDRSVEGYPASVTFSPDGRTTFATIEGGSGVLAFPTRQADDDFGHAVRDPIFEGISRSFGTAGFSTRNVVAVQTDAGPRGIAFTSEFDAHVYNFLDRSVQRVDTKAVGRAVYGGNLGNGTFVAATAEPVLVTEKTLPPAVETGRRLFYSTNDSRMSSDSVGLSCATCHFDSRADGVTWTFDRGVRQTPSLAGEVTKTEPVRWEGERATVAEDARMTSQGLMGGSNIQEDEIMAVTAFIDWTRDVDPAFSADDPDVLAGKAIFERGDVACANCHAGERYTDNKRYDMLGINGVVTRSLVGIAGSPPYFHDGSAKTLRDVLERARDGSMGYTGDLSEQEMEQLEKYLRSL